MIRDLKNNVLLDTHFSKAESGVIRTLLYFDIFHYPLTLDELVRFHPHTNTRDEITRALDDLLSRSIIFNHHIFYSLRSEEGFAQRRKDGNELAKKRLRTAKKFSRLISKFPFVQAIMISGSLSKDYMDEDSDIDYFIITQPGRLWLTRGLLALFKRVFLLNSHKFFCTNYLIDSASLEIEEKNTYTAIETATLVAVYGRELSEKFISENHWTQLFLPNIAELRTSFIPENASWFKKWSERLLSGFIGERLDIFLMNVAMNRWKKQFGNSFSPADFELAFKSGRGVSKNHPRFFQKKILECYKEKIETFEMLNNVKLSA